MGLLLLLLLLLVLLLLFFCLLVGLLVSSSLDCFLLDDEDMLLKCVDLEQSGSKLCKQFKSTLSAAICGFDSTSCCMCQ